MVIAIIALLMSILMPTLQRVRRQAKAVACRASFRQWGPVLDMYASDDPQMLRERWWPEILVPETSNIAGITRRIAFCPATTTRHKGPLGHAEKATAWIATDAFSTWDLGSGSSYGALGSYGLNGWLGNEFPPYKDVEHKDWYWCAFESHGSNQIPVLMDCRMVEGGPDERDPPPEYEDKISASNYARYQMVRFCINRHDGGVNGLFMDWSVRKVGLKELWTLKWNRQFDTRGKWTKAGGVKPEDWPEWMRGFKDY